jgi:hypothetical protein
VKKTVILAFVRKFCRGPNFFASGRIFLLIWPKVWPGVGNTGEVGKQMCGVWTEHVGVPDTGNILSLLNGTGTEPRTIVADPNSSTFAKSE